MSFNGWGGLKKANLAQSALQLSQEVSLLQITVFTVNIVHFQPQLLHHLKVVVQDEALGKFRIKAVLDFLRSANLTQRNKYSEGISLQKQTP